MMGIDQSSGSSSGSSSRLADQNSLGDREHCPKGSFYVGDSAFTWEGAKSKYIKNQLEELLDVTGREEPAVDDGLKKYEGRSFPNGISLKKRLKADLMTASRWVQKLKEDEKGLVMYRKVLSDTGRGENHEKDDQEVTELLKEYDDKLQTFANVTSLLERLRDDLMARYLKASYWEKKLQVMDEEGSEKTETRFVSTRMPNYWDKNKI